MDDACLAMPVHGANGFGGHHLFQSYFHRAAVVIVINLTIALAIVDYLFLLKHVSCPCRGQS